MHKCAYACRRSLAQRRVGCTQECEVLKVLDSAVSECTRELKRTIYLLDRAVVNRAHDAVWDTEVGALIRLQCQQLLCQGLQALNGGSSTLNHHVQLKAVIFSTEQCLLILVLPHELYITHPKSALHGSTLHVCHAAKCSSQKQVM
jgi:hypothetical protein